MKEVAKLLGIELREEFEIKGAISNPYHFSKFGLVDKFGCYCNTFLTSLLNGEMEIQKPILDEVEKKYLEMAIKNWKGKIFYITKENFSDKYSDNYERLVISKSCVATMKTNERIYFPIFEKGTMYKNMETNKEYTLEELGLFK